MNICKWETYFILICQNIPFIYMQKMTCLTKI